MTPARERRRLLASSHLAEIKAQLTKARAGRVLKACVNEVTPQTAGRVFKGHDHQISTLIDIADALNCDVEIVIHRRSV